MSCEPRDVSAVIFDWRAAIASDRSVTNSTCRLAAMLGSQFRANATTVLSFSGSELAAQTGCTPRGAGKQMASLIAGGHIQVHRGRGRGRKNKYLLIRK